MTASEELSRWVDQMVVSILQEEDEDFERVLFNEYPCGELSTSATKIAEVGGAGNVTVRVIVLEQIANEHFKNMSEAWFFCAVADDSGAALLCANAEHLPPRTPALRELLRPGAVLRIANLKTTTLQGQLALSLSRHSTLTLLGHDALPYLVNFSASKTG